MNQPVSRLGTSPEEGIKAPVVVTATSNITLSGEQTINSVSVVAGNRVLVMGQTDSTENGIYVAKTTSWVRATDFNEADDVVNGVLVLSANNGYVYQAVFSGTYTPGTTAMTFTRNVFSDLQSEQFFYDNHASSAANAYAVQVPSAKTTPTAYLANQIVTFRPSHANTSTTVTLRILGASGLLSALPYVMEDGSTLPTVGFLTTDRDVTVRLSSDSTKWIHVWKKIDAATPPTFTTITGNARDNTNLDSELDAITTALHKFYTNHASSAADVYVISPTVSPLPTAWVTNGLYVFSPSHANTGAFTVNIYGLNGLIGAKSFKMEDGSDPVAGFCVPTEYITARYDGTNLVRVHGGNITLTESRGFSFGGLVSVTATPYSVLSTNYGYCHTLSASASSLTMPAIADVDTGQSFSFINNLTTNCTIARDGSSTFAGVNSYNSTTTLVTLAPGTAAVITKASASTWQVQFMGSTHGERILYVSTITAAASISLPLATLDPAQSVFNEYEVVLMNYQPTTTDKYLTAEFSSDNGSTWVATGYYSVAIGNDSSSNTSSILQSNATIAIIAGASAGSDSLSSAAGASAWSIMRLLGFNTGSSLKPRLAVNTGYWEATGAYVNQSASASNGAAADYDAVRFAFEGSDNFQAQGYIVVRKLAKAVG